MGKSIPFLGAPVGHRSFGAPVGNIFPFFGTQIFLAGTQIILADTKIISAGIEIILAGTKIILAGGEIILAGGEIILTGGEVILTCGEIISLFTESQCRLVISQTIQLGFWRFGA